MLVGLFIVLLMHQDVFRDIDYVAYDMRAKLRSTTAVPMEDIIIIGIGERDLLSLQPQIGDWPWPRHVIAGVIDHCREARVVVTDIAFAGEAVPTLERDLSPPIESPQAFLNRGERVPMKREYGDFYLTWAVEKNSNVVSTAYYHMYDELGVPPSGMEKHHLPNVDIPEDGYGMSVPFPALLESSKRVGFVNFRRDTDGKARSARIGARIGDHVVPSLPLAAAMEFLDLAPEDVLLEGRRLTLKDRHIVLNEDGSFNISWRPNIDEIGAYPVIEVSEVLSCLGKTSKESFEEAFPKEEYPDARYIGPETFHDKIVIIGSVSDELLRDMESTPLDKEMAGVMLNAVAIDNLLSGERIYKTAGWATAILTLLCAIVPILFYRSRRHPMHLLWVLLAAATFLIALAVAAIMWLNQMIPLTGPLIALLTTTFGLVVSNWLQETVRRESLEEMERVKQSFTDMLVHDLKNTIAPVIMSLELVRKNPESSFSKEEFPYYVEQTYNQLLLQVNSLLDIRRMEEGRMKLRKSPNCLLQMLYSLQSEYRVAAHRMNLKIVISEGPQAHEVFLFDDIVMRRILENLLWNAIKYASVGSEIGMYCGMSGPREFEFKITNACRPITEHKLRDIFGAFVVGESDVTLGKISSSGLGLGFCKLAVEGHGGSIRLHSPAPDRNDGFQVHCVMKNIESPMPILNEEIEPESNMADSTFSPEATGIQHQSR